MKVVLSKIPRPIIYFLIIMLIISIAYFLIPKYQLINHSGSIYKLNRLTGQVTRVSEISYPTKIKIPSSKTLVSPDSPIGKFLNSIRKTPDESLIP